MISGYFIKHNDENFVIEVILTQKDSGYNVVPKSVDPWNKYEIEDVQAYVASHPEMEVVWDESAQIYVPVVPEEG